MGGDIDLRHADQFRDHWNDGDIDHHDRGGRCYPLTSHSIFYRRRDHSCDCADLSYCVRSHYHDDYVSWISFPYHLHYQFRDFVWTSIRVHCTYYHCQSVQHPSHHVNPYDFVVYLFRNDILNHPSIDVCHDDDDFLNCCVHHFYRMNVSFSVAAFDYHRGRGHPCCNIHHSDSYLPLSLPHDCAFDHDVKCWYYYHPLYDDHHPDVCRRHQLYSFWIPTLQLQRLPLLTL